MQIFFKFHLESLEQHNDDNVADEDDDDDEERNKVKKKHEAKLKIMLIAVEERRYYEIECGEEWIINSERDLHSNDHVIFRLKYLIIGHFVSAIVCLCVPGGN